MDVQEGLVLVYTGRDYHAVRETYGVIMGAAAPAVIRCCGICKFGVVLGVGPAHHGRPWVEAEEEKAVARENTSGFDTLGRPSLSDADQPVSWNRLPNRNAESDPY